MTLHDLDDSLYLILQFLQKSLYLKPVRVPINIFHVFSVLENNLLDFLIILSLFLSSLKFICIGYTQNATTENDSDDVTRNF